MVIQSALSKKIFFIAVQNGRIVSFVEDGMYFLSSFGISSGIHKLLRVSCIILNTGLKFHWVHNRSVVYPYPMKRVSCLAGSFDWMENGE
jgi:hypothetical protein